MSRLTCLSLIGALVAVVLILLAGDFSSSVRARQATEMATPSATASVTPNAIVTPQDISAHIAAIEGPRHGLGSAAERTRLSEVRDYIHNQLAGFGLDVQEDPVTYSGETFPNVIGTLQGAVCPGTSFVVGAHYDTVGSTPGADDNASGVAAMLETARILSVQSFQPSIEFVAFSFEEDGLVGSQQMAQDKAGDPGKDVIGMLSLDMIGYTCDDPGCQTYPADLPPHPSAPDVGNFIAVIGNSASAPLLQTFVEASASAVPSLPVFGVPEPGECDEPEPPVYCQYFRLGSDHAPFLDQGYQALLVTDTAGYRNPNYHQPSDTLSTLDLEFAADVANAAVAVVANASLALTCSPTPTNTPTPTPTHTPAGTPTDTPTPAACTPPFTGIVPNDRDCDGATDDAEAGGDPATCGTRDPNDPWDFYDVPVPTLDGGGTMYDRDSAVTLFNDVLAVLEYSGTIDEGPPNGAGRDYDDDWDGDGIDDGVAYDRDVGAPWPELGVGKSHSGPPDDAVTLFVDVLLVLDQSGHICTP